MSEKSKHEEMHEGNLKKFGVIILVMEAIIISLYIIFVRFELHSGDNQNINRYPAYQDVNVMMLIGFGFLMTFIKKHSWSALSYTFFINAFVAQAYILLSGFWFRVFQGFNGTFIEVKQTNFISASYSVASILIAFGAVLGRIGPMELLIMGIVHIVGYTLNEQIIYTVIKAFDAGGSMVIHTYGAYFGLTVSLILSKVVWPVTKPQSNYNSNIFGMIGTLFLWMFWPSFNFGTYANTDYEKSQIIINTILSLIGSCLSTFMMSAFLKKNLNMEDILNATLAGGVVIGASCAILYNPGISLLIGFFIGIISTLAYHYLSDILHQKIGLCDTCGVHNLHGIPGLIGGLISAAAIATYAHPSTFNTAVASNTYITLLQNVVGGSYYTQASIQVAATFISLGMAIVFGIGAGFLIKMIYSYDPQQFFEDKVYFDGTEDEEGALKFKEKSEQSQILKKNKVMFREENHEIQRKNKYGNDDQSHSINALEEHHQGEIQREQDKIPESNKPFSKPEMVDENF